MPADLSAQSSQLIAVARAAVGRVWLLSVIALALTLLLAAQLSGSAPAQRVLSIAALGVALTGLPRFGRLVPILTGLVAVVFAIAAGNGFRESTGVYLALSAFALLVAALVELVARRQRVTLDALHELEDVNKSMGIRDAVEMALAGGRRHNYIQREIGRAGRYKRNLTLAVLAIDNLHLFRAERGEESARAALAALGDLFSKDSRLPDGGISDDLHLTFVLPETSLLGGRVVVERVRLAFLELNISGANDVPLTASVGIVSCWEDGDTASELTTAANEALRYAQALGGNRSVMAHGPDGTPTSWVMPGGEVIDDLAYDDF